METNVHDGLATPHKATCPVSGGQIFLGACAIIVILFVVAAGGAVHHFDNVRVPALISDTASGK